MRGETPWRRSEMGPAESDSDPRAGHPAAQWARRQSLEARAAAAIRALTGRAGVHFEAGRPWNGDSLLPDTAPHLQPRPGLDDLAAYRGLADALALRLRYSSAEIQARGAPADDPVAALVFEWLEQWRVESLAPDCWPGMRGNLQTRFDRWTDLLLGSGLADTSSGLLLLCFAQLTWSRLFDVAVPEALADLLEAVRLEMGPVLAEPLARLAALRSDQAGYAREAHPLACTLADWFAVLRPPQGGPAPRRRLAFSIDLPSADDTGESLGAISAGGPAPPAAPMAYRVWTRRHDQVCDAASLVRPALLREYRQRLDEALAGQSWGLGALARALRQMLQRPQPEGWAFQQEEGRIDGRRLAQLISSPHDHAVFHQERHASVVQAHIALLIDCSGSMKQHGLRLALMADVLARACERADVSFESLGFTTRAWNGGRPAREWYARNRMPAHPGRLNELRHLVFQAAEMSRQERRLGPTALLKPDLFCEGIDGEAVQWACERLLARPEPGRRILWVVSDGGPMDAATALANPPGFLDAHLRSVVRRAQGESGIEILGIGVGQDLSAYYPHSVALDLEDGLDMHAFLSLIRTLAGR